MDSKEKRIIVMEQYAMALVEHFSLKAYNSFGIDVMARRFAAFSSPEELAAYLGSEKGPLLVLGGGSNILLTKDFEGLVLKNEILGNTMIREDPQQVYVRVGAGENWHGFVQYCLSRNWGGVENLSLIPGSVGAAPIQNIGAYGVEQKNVFYELEAWSLSENKVVTFTAQDCEFGYRDSVFKGRYRNRFIILHVIFRLDKVPVFNTDYGALREELDKMGVRELSIQAISEAVIRIRRSKLPDPAQIGNAGSFFKNPSVSESQGLRLKKEHPGIVCYPNPDKTYKLAAAWLIEQCGWKGYRKGDAGCHSRQALVLVNYGHATGAELLALAREIRESVKKKFDVELESEVNII